jgi:hypothetical protein
MVTNQEIQDRVDFIKKVSCEVIDEVFERVYNKHGIQIISKHDLSASLDERAIRDSVEYYYFKLLHDYKRVNKFYQNNLLSGRDKLAALTAIALLTFKPIRHFKFSTHIVEVELINETLALRCALTALKIDPNKISDRVQAELLFKNMLHNLFSLGNEASRRGQSGKPIESTELITFWVIQTMQVFGLAFGEIDLGATEGKTS